MEKKQYENLDIREDLKKSYLLYSMSVITSRAIPDARDGLKPVNRRIIYAMNSLGLTHDKQFKKSARVVGEVIGKYHPHGESSIYGGLVHLAQPFTMNHPLVNGHGNFGSIDGDPPAAQRYTEVKLSKISSLLTLDLNKETVDFRKNYDGSEKEPMVLPSYFPNLLVNGTFGIAVGMSTSIPPHNFVEVSNAVIAVAKNPSIDDQELLPIIKGPDFPTGGIIQGDEDIKKAYLNGYGGYVLESKYHLEENKRNKKVSIIITEIPFNVNKSDVLVKIGELSRKGVIKEISDLRDESNHGKIRIKITLKRSVEVPVFINKIFKKTNLRVKVKINMLALVNNQPKVLTLKELLTIYVDHQKEVIKRKTEFELKKALDRLHIIDGLVIALENIDKVVRIIKEANSPALAKISLMETFHLSEIQSKAILEMQLQRLTSLEIEKIKKEQIQLEEKIKDCKDILENDYRVVEIIINQQISNIEKYGSNRKTRIVPGKIVELSEEDWIKDDPVYVSISNNGYLKRLDRAIFKVQKRGGKGKAGFGLNEDDYAKCIVSTTNKSDVFFITSKGRIYKLKVYKIPFFSKTSKGAYITNFLERLNTDDEKITCVVDFRKISTADYLVFVTKKGIIKKTSVEFFKKVNKTGKRAIELNSGDIVCDTHLAKEDDEIVIVGSNNKLIRFGVGDLRPNGRQAKGVKAIKLEANEFVTCSSIVKEKDEIVLILNNSKAKKLDVNAIRRIKRNGVGVQGIKKREKNERIINICRIKENDVLLLTTKKGNVINVKGSEIRKLSRNAHGSTIIKLVENDEVISIVPIEEIEKKDEELEEWENNVSHETISKINE